MGNRGLSPIIFLVLFSLETVVCPLLFHDPKVTMRYAHLSPQAMLDAVNVVGNVVGRRPMVANQAEMATA